MTFPDTYPVVLGTVTTPAGLKYLSRGKLPCHAVEIRVDALLAQNTPVTEIEKALRKKKQPVLLTLRIPAEGGQLAWKVAERRALFLRLLPLVEAIDVELATARVMAPVLAVAKRAGKAVILSAHAIEKPATPAQFSRWVKQGDTLQPTVLKVAARIKSWHDLQRLAALLVNFPGRAIAAMGLGPYAAQSRSVLAALGSRLVYGYLDKPAAPGQPSAAAAAKMAQVVRDLKA
jgi:3-dehydroquinate dehydratase I